MSGPPRKLAEDFNLQSRPMMEEDINRLHQLSIGVGWPHRAEDWRLLMAVGHGLVACDPIDRVLGSAMWFPMGPRFTTIGMVITSPKLQAMGAGRWLMNEVLERAGKGRRGLNATRAAYKLYFSLGFEPVATVFQRQGFCVAPSRVALPAGTNLRAVGPESFDTILKADYAAYGEPRERLIRRLLEVGETLLLEREGEAIGFSICRRFGRGQLVGPIVAENAASAIALTAPFAERHAGSFLRVDTAKDDPEFLAFLDSIGVAPFDTVTQMRLGPARKSSGGVETWGLTFHALG